MSFALLRRPGPTLHPRRGRACPMLRLPTSFMTGAQLAPEHLRNMTVAVLHFVSHRQQNRRNERWFMPPMFALRPTRR